jgi:hypothetical protein
MQLFCKFNTDAHVLLGHHDNQQNDIKRNNTQHNIKVMVVLSVIMVNVSDAKC